MLITSALALIGCGGPSDHQDSSSTAKSILTVVNVDGPTIDLVINGRRLITAMHCGDANIKLSTAGLRYPLDVQVQRDRTTFTQTTITSAGDHTLVIRSDRVLVDGSGGGSAVSPCPS